MAVLLSWNCHGFHQHASDLRDLINYYHPICVALQETFLQSTKFAKIRNYSIFRKDNDNENRTSGGVALLISHDYPCSPVHLQTDLQAVAVKIHIRSVITVCSLYLPPSSNIRQTTLNNLISQLPKPFFILGDMNGHSPLWGSLDSNNRGLQIEKLLCDHDLCLFNTNQITYFHLPNRSYHSLDLAISSPQLYPFWDFNVDKDLHNSDHFPIILSENISTTPIQRITRYVLDTADWNHFSAVANITEDMVKNNSIDEAVQIVTSTIISAADSSIRKSSGLFRRQTKPWWNQDCKMTYKDQRRAWNKFKRYPTTENFMYYKKCKATFRRTLRRSQKNSWASYVSSISNCISSKQMWAKVRRCSGVYPNNQIHILEHKNQTISSISDIANAIASSFSNISAATSYPPSFSKQKATLEKTKLNFQTKKNLSYNRDFNMLELKRALHNTKRTNAGPDNISYVMIKHLSTSSLSNLLCLFNRIWNERSYPSLWRMATIIPILKPNKDPTNPLSYRPIALTSCLSKILEKMISSRLTHYLELNNCLSLYQSGFRRGRSTIDNIVNLEGRIRNAFLRRNHLVAVFFDIEKAYDRTWRYGIKEIIQF